MDLLVKWSSNMPTFEYLLAGFAVAGFYGYYVKHINPTDARRPPGPKSLPLIGNLLDIPQGDEAGVFAKWAKQYGEIVYLEALGRPLIILNSPRWTHELLKKRSLVSSDRINLPMMHDLLGLGWFLPQAHYGESWRRLRLLFHNALRANVVESYHDLQYEETLAMLRRLLTSPEEFRSHIRYSVQAKILRIAYGYRTKGLDDPLIIMEEEGMGAAVDATAPGKFLVDLIPALKYVPEWVPGSSFQRKAREWREMLYILRTEPFERVKQEMKNGNASHCFVSTLLEEAHDRPSDQDIKDSAAAVYGAGSDTTFASLYTFILAMLLHPEVQARAQAELDCVLGGRLPQMEDRAHLPYLEATYKELMRWEPVAPIGVPHMLSQDVICDRYFLPAGSTVFGNTWSITHFLNLQLKFTIVLVFDPSRFLDKEGKLVTGVVDPMDFVFGYGRRVCPGRHLADVSVWITICAILTVFDILPAKDDKGSVIEVKPKFVSGVIRSPKPFNCIIKPRSQAAANLVVGAGV
ncbi:O-methylsterigmatocystin oxidoreductase [Leucoagaricus sp. SymC.cos]|nr:O-methylsterigmatocystin oxidoreductase [Leucoagaricus sp. SymC.cos]